MVLAAPTVTVCAAAVRAAAMTAAATSIRRNPRFIAIPGPPGRCGRGMIRDARDGVNTGRRRGSSRRNGCIPRRIASGCSGHTAASRRLKAVHARRLRGRTRRGTAAQRFALRPGLPIANSSSLWPALSSARSQRGVAPRPAQVSSRFFGLRYFGGTLRPLSLLPRGFGPRLAPPLPRLIPKPRPSRAASFASSSRRVDSALLEIMRATLSRRVTKSSNDIDVSFAIYSSPTVNGATIHISYLTQTASTVDTLSPRVPQPPRGLCGKFIPSWLREKAAGLCYANRERPAFNAGIAIRNAYKLFVQLEVNFYGAGRFLCQTRARKRPIRRFAAAANRTLERPAGLGESHRKAWSAQAHFGSGRSRRGAFRHHVHGNALRNRPCALVRKPHRGGGRQGPGQHAGRLGGALCARHGFG